MRISNLVAVDLFRVDFCCIVLILVRFSFKFFILRRDYSEDYIPKSACLQLVANSEQYLSSIAARRLLTYEKISEPGIGTENVSDILDDFRFKFFARDEKERLEKIEIKKRGKLEAAKRGKILVDKK